MVSALEIDVRGAIEGVIDDCDYAVTANEWVRYGIRCNCFAPGLIASPRAVEAWDRAGLDPARISEGIPLRRPGPQMNSQT